jgi:HlyD family secretion protein
MNQQSHPSTQEIETALGLSPHRRRSRWIKRGLLTLVLLALALGGYWLYARQQESAGNISYETVPASKADVVVAVAATGTIQPITQVDISSEAAGVVREVLVDENGLVKTGDVLALLDTTRLNAQRNGSLAQVQAADARLLQAQATATQTRLNENRQKALRTRGLSTGQDMDNAEAETLRADAAFAVATADVAAAKAALSVIDADLAKMKLISPIDGVILKRSVEPGQTVSASLTATVLFQIAQDLSRIQLEAAVDEADIGQVKVGQTASFTVDAYRTRNFPARIERLSYAPETVDGVVTYKAILSAANEDLALRPGMTATARIVVEEYDQVLTLANEALRYQPPVVQPSEGFSITRMFMPRFPRGNRTKRTEAKDGTRSIYVLRDGKPVEVKVKLGATDGKITVITEGDVKADDLVVIAQKQASRP